MFKFMVRVAGTIFGLMCCAPIGVIIVLTFLLSVMSDFSNKVSNYLITLYGNKVEQFNSWGKWG